MSQPHLEATHAAPAALHQFRHCLHGAEPMDDDLGRYGREATAPRRLG